MPDRRNFLRNGAALAGAALFFSERLFAREYFLQPIGIQLFSLPKMLDEDFAGSIAMLSGIGYKEAELYGPYPFSTKAAQERWAAVTPSLGFKGSGFFGHSAGEVKEIFAKNNMRIPSMHTDLDTLENAMGKLAEAANTLGATYVILPAIPEDQRKTPDDYKKMADRFNRIGANAKKEGVRFGYHNHGYGLKETDGVIPLYLILDNTDPSLVYLEMDLYWTTAGGADPMALLTKYPGRYKLMHVKDMARKVRFSGDGGDSKQWIELFPYMTTAGSGVLDLKNILPKAKQAGVDHFIVEQDMVKDPQIALKKSYDYINTI
jgi:sugar phosphate isomerase/epimerase